MKLNRKLISALLSVVLMLNLFMSTVSAVEYQADYLPASYADIATSAYSRIIELHNGVIGVCNAQGLWGLADLNGNMIMPYQFALMEGLGNGFYRVSDSESGYYYSGGQEAVIDSTGAVRIPMGGYTFDEKNGIIRQVVGRSWDEEWYFYHNTDLSPATEDEYYGYSSYSASTYALNRDQYILSSDLEFDDFVITSTGFILYLGNECAFVTFDKQVLIPYGTYDRIYSSNTDGYLIVMDYINDYYYGVVDVSTGEVRVVIELGQYTYIDDGGYPGTFSVRSDSLRGLISSTGATIIPLGDYDYMGSVNNQGYIATSNYDYDSSHKKCNFDSKLYHVETGLVSSWNDREINTETYYRDAAFSLNGVQHGFMNPYGVTLLAPLYEYLDPIGNDGLIRTYRYSIGKYGLLSTNTYTFLMAEIYSDISYLGNNCFKYYYNRAYGINSVENEVVTEKIPGIYKSLTVYSHNFIYAYDGSRYSVLNMDNQYVIEPSSKAIDLYKGDGYFNPSEALYDAQRYDGYEDTVMPYISYPNGSYLTSYVDYHTGEVRGTLSAYASNLDAEGWFVYMDPNTGKYGVGKVRNYATLFSGLKPDENGVWWYYIEDVVQTEYTGLVQHTDGNWYYIENGAVNPAYTGLTEYAGTWFYVSGGILDLSYTGLAQYAGNWYYVAGGVLDFTYTGLTEYFGNWYYIENGALNWNYTGLTLYGGNWYYVAGGVLDVAYTGLVEYCGGWYYVENGALNWGYTGLATYYGNWYYVENGVLNFGYTGLVQYIDGNWYYVENGALNFGYTGLAEYFGGWFYIENGILNFGYTGLAEYYGGWYYVQNGVLDWTYTGTCEYNGVIYNVVGGVVVF